ncbi:GON-4-like protein isoform X3 [Leuresthes tenuis]|uniref:GON-4-like protein isoform X3 n=1 Tax=Leuresthes tenuis TaxID=355514 RepID=UPI003B50225D
MERRRPAEDDVCPLRVKSVRRTDATPEVTQDELGPRAWAQNPAATGAESSEDELGRLDIDLNRKSRQLNLTSSNVRAILHEVITHKHVVAMMKAAIRDTQDLPMFEPKMTRSRLKQAAQHVQPLRWSQSAVNTLKPPQFVDIDLEEDEDSSDEEYCPDDEEEEDEDTAEETILSDGDSLASPPRIHLRPKPLEDRGTQEPPQSAAGHLSQQVRSSSCALPADCSFLERLNAVEEELDSSPSYTYDQSLDRKADDGGGDDGIGCLAFRTRSKLPLVNVPLDQLEAELLAPDITDDMYDQSSAQRDEDRHWTKWLQGLMAPDYEDEADDDDDPEYNFLEDLDEPDLEDYRTDRAVRITKKEVNELLEELFDTLQEENAAAEDEEQEEEEAPSAPKFNIPQTLRFEAPLASMLTERRKTVRKQYEAAQQRRALNDTISHFQNSTTLKDPPITSILVLPGQVCPALHLDHAQKLQLQQQLQQHVQLLTQVHLLSRHVSALQHEASITKRYLEELQRFASCREEMCLPSSFRVCNLQGALNILQDVEQRAEPPPPPPAASRRWLPAMNPATSSYAFPLMPADAAWLFATRPVFLYPELLPVCSLDPALHSRHQRSVYTAGEDGLIVLGLKHFEGAVQSDQLISSYLLCKSRWNFRKHIREMSGPRAPPTSIIKMFLTQGVIPPLPCACNRVHTDDQRPPVDRNTLNMPNWLKNSRLIIQKTKLDAACYPSSLPPGCTLRLHPYYVSKSRSRGHSRRRLFTLAHNASLLPLAKAPADRQVDLQPISRLSPPPGVSLLSPSPVMSGALPFVPSPACGAVPLTAASMSADIIQHGLPIGQTAQQDGTTSLPLFLPIHSLSNTTSPITPSSVAAEKSGYFLLQMVWPPPAPSSATSQHALVHHFHEPVKEEHEVETIAKLRPISEEEMKVGVSQVESYSSTPSSDRTSGEEEQEEEEEWAVPAVSLSGGENGAGGDPERSDKDGAEGEGEGEGVEEGEEDDREREEGEGEREEEGDGDKDEDQDRQGEEEEEEEEEDEEDFDDLTQDEDEEEVMSSASEESVLSVPELQETMKQLTWLAAERQLCVDADSEEDHSPTSPGSQEEEEEEEEGSKGEESGEGRRGKVGLDEERPSGQGTARGGGRCPGRGRGRSRPHRGLRRSRQERHSKDATKLLLLYDENLLDNDPHRESKDMAFAQSYLNRVREALQDTPGQVEEFVSLLNRFEQVGDGQQVTLLFRKLHCILGNRTDLLRDFAAFLHPEQALQCGLFEEQQAFERSRRFLRQLEISFGDNPSHYQKIIKVLQTGLDLSPNSIHELKAQMAALLKGHTHLQTEFWVFFDELRPPPACPGEFEEAHWPEEGEGGEGVGLRSGGGASGGFEDVTLPELEDEEEGQKIQPMTSRRQRRKMDAHRSYKDCDWSDKEWPCLCRDVKLRRHTRKGCSRCHGNQTSGGVSRAMKSLDPLYAQITRAHDPPGEKNLDVKEVDGSPQPDRSGASWAGSYPEEEEEELDDEEGDEEEERKKRREDMLQHHTCPTIPASSITPASTLPVSNSSSITPASTLPVSNSSSITPASTLPVSNSSSITPASTLPVSNSSSITPASILPVSNSSSITPASTLPVSNSSSITPASSSITPASSSSILPASPSSILSSSISPASSSISPASSSISPASSSILPSSSSITPSSTLPVSNSSSITPASTLPVSNSSSITPASSSISPASSSILPSSSSILPASSSSPALPRPSPPLDLPVCAKNISLTASGEKVILWTREADRVILTMCQQEGANQNTFQAISSLLSNKTPNEVSRRFRDLMRLFRTAARQTSSEDEAPPTEPRAANETED